MAAKDVRENGDGGKPDNGGDSQLVSQLQKKIVKLMNDNEALEQDKRHRESQWVKYFKDCEKKEEQMQKEIDRLNGLLHPSTDSGNRQRASTVSNRGKIETPRPRKKQRLMSVRNLPSHAVGSPQWHQELQSNLANTLKASLAPAPASSNGNTAAQGTTGATGNGGTISVTTPCGNGNTTRVIAVGPKSCVQRIPIGDGLFLTDGNDQFMLHAGKGQELRYNDENGSTHVTCSGGRIGHALDSMRKRKEKKKRQKEKRKETQK